MTDDLTTGSGIERIQALERSSARGARCRDDPVRDRECQNRSFSSVFKGRAETARRGARAVLRAVADPARMGAGVGVRRRLARAGVVARAVVGPRASHRADVAHAPRPRSRWTRSIARRLRLRSPLRPHDVVANARACAIDPRRCATRRALARRRLRLPRGHAGANGRARRLGGIDPRDDEARRLRQPRSLGRSGRDRSGARSCRRARVGERERSLATSVRRRRDRGARRAVDGRAARSRCSWWGTRTAG